MRFENVYEIMKQNTSSMHTDTELLSLVSNVESRDKRSNLKGIKAFTANTKMYPYAEVEFDYIIGEQKIRRRGRIIGYIMTNEELVSLIIQGHPIKSMNLKRSTTIIMKTLFRLKKVAVVERTIVGKDDGYYHFEYNVNF
jgi:hypothetical protein